MPQLVPFYFINQVLFAFAIVILLSEFGIWNTIPTFRGCSMAFPFFECILLRKLTNHFYSFIACFILCSREIINFVRCNIPSVFSIITLLSVCLLFRAFICPTFFYVFLVVVYHIIIIFIFISFSLSHYVRSSF